MLKVQGFCEKNNIQYVEIQGPGMENLIRKKGIFPNRVQKYCTEELKIKPITQWRVENKLDHKNCTMYIGVRRAESKARANTTSTAVLRGIDAVYPLAYLSDDERDELIVRAGFEVLPHRSCECSPCIFERNKKSLRRLEAERVDLIDNLEQDISYFTNAKRKLQKDPRHDENEIFGFFNSSNIKVGKTGIREQVAWANSGRGQYNPAQQELDFCDDEVGFCGV
jgi:hypothetical protein